MLKRARIAEGSLVRPLDNTQLVSEPIPAPTDSASSTFKIVVGTYEKLLYGLEGRFAPDSDPSNQPNITLTPLFIFPAHVACVKALGASPHGGKWLATGSTDEIIKIWDLRRRKEVGGLVQHQGQLILV